MRRTVSKMGNSSLVMSLPSKWAKENNVQKGDELHVEPFEKGLTVSLTNIRKKERTLELDISRLTKRTVLNILNNAYRSGYVTLKLRFKDNNQLSYITETVRNKLLGFEVIEERLNQCTIQNVAEPSYEQLDTIIRKIFLITKQISDQILDDFKNNNLRNNKLGNIDRLEQSKDTVDNFTNFARRTILSICYGGKEKSYFLWAVIAKLSLINHAYIYFYQNSRPSKEAIVILTKINSQFNLLYEAFYQKDYFKLDKIDVLKKELHELILRQVKKDPAMCYLFELVRNIQMAASYLHGYYLN